MKKTISLLLAVLLATGFAAGCADSGGTPATESVTQDAPVTGAVTEPETTDEPETETGTEPVTEEETEPVTYGEFTVVPDDGVTLSVPRIYGDHMVLQRDEKITIRGFSDRDGTEIRGLFMDDEARAVAADGKWELVFSPKPATAEPQTLTIDDSCGNSVKFEDVLVGDVWFIGGQSNSEITFTELPTLVSSLSVDESMPVRLFMQGASYVINHREEAKEPCEDIVNPYWYWKRLNRGNAVSFSALGYYFACIIEKETDVPVGMVSIAASGAKINEFMPAELVKEFKYKVGGNVGPSEFYNMLVHPFVGMRFKGLIFFQGESEGYNGANPSPKKYSHDFKALISEYRQRWGFEFPVYNVQLSDYTSKGITFCPNSGYIRAQQFNAYQNMTGVRLIPSYDLGSDENDPNFMHSPYKKELAERIAQAVLADLYGADGAEKTYPPEIVSATLSDDKTYFTVKFKNVGDGLISDSGDGKVDGFGVGTVTKLIPAEAEIISADTVKVTVPEKAKLSGIGYAASPHVEKDSSHLRSSYGMPALAFYKAVN